MSFLKSEIPDVIQQLLAWKLASSLIGAASCLAVVLAYAMFVRAVIKAKPGTLLKDGYGDLNVESGFGLIIGGIVSIVMALLAVKPISTALQIFIAPKIFLIEYAASLAK